MLVLLVIWGNSLWVNIWFVYFSHDIRAPPPYTSTQHNNPGYIHAWARLPAWMCLDVPGRAWTIANCMNTAWMRRNEKWEDHQLDAWRRSLKVVDWMDVTEVDCLRDGSVLVVINWSFFTAFGVLRGCVMLLNRCGWVAWGLVTPTYGFGWSHDDGVGGWG